VDYDRIADIYDLFVQSVADVPFFLEHARKSSGAVLDLMAGTGRISIPLAGAGISVTCVDSSHEMVSVLRAKLRQCGLRAEVKEMDVRVLCLEKRFGLIIIPFNSFSEIVPVDEERRVLERVHAHLLENGRFICTLHNPAARLPLADGKLHLRANVTLPTHGVLRLSTWENFDEATGIVNGVEFFKEFDRYGNRHSKRNLDIHFRIVTREEFEALAGAAGFRVVELYGDYSGSSYQEETSPYMIWVLEKKHEGPADEGPSRLLSS
jgi:SAM-dependent methyltransferase